MQLRRFVIPPSVGPSKNPLEVDAVINANPIAMLVSSVRSATNAFIMTGEPLKYNQKGFIYIYIYIYIYIVSIVFMHLYMHTKYYFFQKNIVVAIIVGYTYNIV